MIYTSIAEIFAAMDDVRERLRRRVENLNDAQQNFRASDGTWSIAELIEHLSIIETNMCALTNKLLAQAEATGARASLDLKIGPISMQQYVEQASGEKYQAPERVSPGGGIPVTESLAKMQRTRESLRALQPRLEAADLSHTSFPHPVFGALDLYKWLAFIGMHEERHLRQIEAIANAPEFDSINKQRAADTST